MSRINYFVLFVLIFLFSCEKRSGGGQFEDAFVNPAESTKPWVYWYWINDNISKEGITRDLEAMSRVGIGEALIGNVVDPALPYGDVKLFSDEWWNCIEHAIYEAERFGIKVGLFNCPGWSQSGGPWVKSEEAMRYLATTEVHVKGPQKLTCKIDAPTNFFQPVSLHAFPAPKDDASGVSTVLHSIKSAEITNAAALFDGDDKTFADFEIYPATIEIKTDSPISIRSLSLIPTKKPMSAQCELYSKEPNGNWKLITNLDVSRDKLTPAIGPLTFGAVCESFESVTASEFKIHFPTGNGGRLSEIELSSASRLSHYVEKQLGKMSPSPVINADTYTWKVSAEPENNEFIVSQADIIDISNKIDSNGVLEWIVPEGEWIIQRTGMALTGTKNTPTTPDGEGYEIDKMNAKIAEMHFDAFIGEVLRRIPAHKRTGLRHVVADSYEQGSQNWTDGFAEIFRQTYGYDPLKWFPVLTGRIVESADMSDRFLWDLRRLIADKISSDYVGTLKEKCEANGLRLWLENYGHWGYPGEFLSYGGASHDIGGEFWLSQPELGPIECRCASSAGHIYGKNVISAEGFTSHWTFNQMPRDLKTRGDWSWTEGINHFVLHVYIHQPDERKPGINAWFGTDFNRHSTWFDASKTYFDYIRRSTGVLQTGNHVADVAYFIGEDAPVMTGSCTPALPRGYDYDFINAEVLLKDAKVKNGRITLSSGASYRMMVLPDRATMRPEILRKISELVTAGAAILGPAPTKSPSVQGYPTCDVEVHTLADKMWGDIDGKSVTQNKYGKGIVMYGVDISAALMDLGTVPDIELEDHILYTHRSCDGAELYFVSNQLQEHTTLDITFRVNGLQPELWNPITGEMRDLPTFSEANGTTTVPMKFGPAESWFVVFRKTASHPQTTSNFPQHTQLVNIEGAWNLTFEPNLGAPTTAILPQLEDLTLNSDPGIKYYSGTVTYSKEFDFNEMINSPLYLNLGQVESIAEITLNGIKLSSTWCYPYRVNVSSVLKSGKNQISVKVVNHWWNRLVGDQQPGAKPITWTAYTGWNAQSSLLSSGLIGPVTIETNNCF